MRWFVLLATLLALHPTSGWGADGDAWSGYTNICSGDLCGEGYFLCDTKTSISTTCDEFDLTRNADADSQGWPTYFTVRIVTTTGCSGTPTVQLRGLDISAGETVNYNPPLKPEASGTESKSFDAEHRYLDATLSDMTGCTDFDVAVILYHLRP